jgi:hypothetical protein
MRLISVRRFLLVVVLAAAALVLPSPPPAAACSCARFDVREELARVDGAFVGFLIARESPQPVDGVYSSATKVRYHFRVERVVRGDVPPETVDVWSSADGASCGLETGPGQRIGLLLRREGDRWTSSLCSQTDPDVLIRAGEPLPPPPGRAPPAVVVGTTHGPGRMVSLDGFGRVIAYGGGDGLATDIAFCPGGDRLAEAYSPPYGGPSSEGPGVAVRTAGSLEVVWERLIGADGGPGDALVADIACTDRDGGTVLVLAVRHVYTETTTRHHALIMSFGRHGEPDVVWQGDATTGTLTADGHTAYLNGGADGQELQLVDLANPGGPATRTLGRLPAGTGTLTIGPDGRYLAGVTTYEYWSGAGSPPPAKAVVVDLSASPAGVGEADLAASYGQYSTAVWSDPDRIVFAPRWEGQPVRVLDRSLREIARWDGLAASHGTVVGDTFVGLDGPEVVVAPVSGGPATGWADLESGLPGAIAAFPGGAAIGRAGQPTTTTTGSGKAGGGTATTTSAPAPTTSRPTEAPSTTSPPPTEPDGAARGDVVALPAPDSGSGTSGRPLLAGGAGAGLLAAGLAGLIRHRRAPKLP